MSENKDTTENLGGTHCSTRTSDDGFYLSCEWVNMFSGSWNGDVWSHPIDGRREIQWGRNSGFLFVASTGNFGSAVKICEKATRGDVRKLCELVGLRLRVEA